MSWKRDEILFAYQSGEIRRIGDNSFAVPSRFFVLGITPKMVAEVIRLSVEAQNGSELIKQREVR